jgi:hypothetical protein
MPTSFGLHQYRAVGLDVPSYRKSEPLRQLLLAALPRFGFRSVDVEDKRWPLLNQLVPNAKRGQVPQPHWVMCEEQQHKAVAVQGGPTEF